jgi:hypothetical protein
MTRLGVLFAAGLWAMVGCASTPPIKPPTSDPTTQWVQAGRKVDFDITQT